MASCDEDPFEFPRRLALFHDVHAKGYLCFALLGKSGLKRSPLVVLGPQAECLNCLTHRSQKSDGAFPDDDVNSVVPQFEPEQSIGRKCGDRVDASAERSAKMI